MTDEDKALLDLLDRITVLRKQAHKGQNHKEWAHYAAAYTELEALLELHGYSITMQDGHHIAKNI